MEKSIISAIQDDLITAGKQGETKFIGSLYGDMLFKVHQLSLRYPGNLEVQDLKSHFDDHFGKFLELIESLNQLTIKLRSDETQKS